MRPDDSTRHELVPLSLATRLVSARAYGADARISLARLTGIAHIMAALVPLYGRGDVEQDVRRLRQEELLSGVFRKDGAELQFRDGRAPLIDIAATQHGIEEVVRVLRSAYDGDDARGLPRDRLSSHP